MKKIIFRWRNLPSNDLMSNVRKINKKRGRKRSWRLRFLRKTRMRIMRSIPCLEKAASWEMRHSKWKSNCLNTISMDLKLKKRWRVIQNRNLLLRRKWMSIRKWPRKRIVCCLRLQSKLIPHRKLNTGCRLQFLLKNGVSWRLHISQEYQSIQWWWREKKAWVWRTSCKSWLV